MSEYSLILEVTSTTPADLTILSESYVKEAGVNKIKFKSKLQTINEVNGNSRIYPKEVCQAIVESLEPKAKRRSLFQEIDHPFLTNQEAQKRRAAIVHLKNCGSMINEIYIDGNNVMGIIETLSGFRGPDLYNLIVHDKADIGFSARLFGKVRPYPGKPSIMEVTLPVKAITYDVVTNPSHSSARVVSLKLENINEFKNDMDYLTESTNEVLLMENANLPTPSSEIINSYIDLILEEAFTSMRPITFKI